MFLASLLLPLLPSLSCVSRRGEGEGLPPMPSVCTPPGRKLSYRLLDHITLRSCWPLTLFCPLLFPRCARPVRLSLVPFACKTLLSPSCLPPNVSLVAPTPFHLLCSVFSVVGLALRCAVSFEYLDTSYHPDISQGQALPVLNHFTWRWKAFSNRSLFTCSVPAG